MKNNGILALLFALSLSCTSVPKDVTKINVTLPLGLDEVELRTADTDTLIKAESGSFSYELPTDDCSLVSLESGPAYLEFVADGTTLDIILSDSSTVSSRSKEISLQEKVNIFMSDISDIDNQEEFKSFALKTINDERQNVLGAIAFTMSYFTMTDEEMGQALTTLSPSAKKMEAVATIERLYNSRMETSEGCMFRDFTVRTVSGYDYGVPVYSRVSLSDYVGQGNFTLLYFWNSSDEASLGQIQYIKEVSKKYSKKGLDIVSLSLLDTAEESIYTSQEQNMDWVCLNGGEAGVANLYGVISLPFVIYFAPDGTILNRDLYGEDIVRAAEHYFSQASK